MRAFRGRKVASFVEWGRAAECEEDKTVMSVHKYQDFTDERKKPVARDKPAARDKQAARDKPAAPKLSQWKQLGRKETRTGRKDYHKKDVERNKHGQPKFCPDCDRSFKTNQNLKKHKCSKSKLIRKR